MSREEGESHPTWFAEDLCGKDCSRRTVPQEKESGTIYRSQTWQHLAHLSVCKLDPNSNIELSNWCRQVSLLTSWEISASEDVTVAYLIFHFWKHWIGDVGWEVSSHAEEVFGVHLRQWWIHWRCRGLRGFQWYFVVETRSVICIQCWCIESNADLRSNIHRFISTYNSR